MVTKMVPTVNMAMNRMTCISRMYEGVAPSDPSKGGGCCWCCCCCCCCDLFEDEPGCGCCCAVRTLDASLPLLLAADTSADPLLARIGLLD